MSKNLVWVRTNLSVRAAQSGSNLEAGRLDQICLWCSGTGKVAVEWGECVVDLPHWQT